MSSIKLKKLGLNVTIIHECDRKCVKSCSDMTIYNEIKMNMNQSLSDKNKERKSILR